MRTMRPLLLIGAFALAALCAAQSQQARDATLAETIDRVMKTGVSWGFDEKALFRGGDAGAVATTAAAATIESGATSGSGAAPASAATVAPEFKDEGSSSQ